MAASSRTLRLAAVHSRGSGSVLVDCAPVATMPPAFLCALPPSTLTPDHHHPSPPFHLSLVKQLDPLNSNFFAVPTIVCSSPEGSPSCATCPPLVQRSSAARPAAAVTTAVGTAATSVVAAAVAWVAPTAAAAAAPDAAVPPARTPAQPPVSPLVCPVVVPVWNMSRISPAGPGVCLSRAR